ncbi:hypothetical protein FRC01_003223, partial [Tulasnella sp. 417]
ENCPSQRINLDRPKPLDIRGQLSGRGSEWMEYKDESNGDDECSNLLRKYVTEDGERSKAGQLVESTKRGIASNTEAGAELVANPPLLPGLIAPCTAAAAAAAAVVARWLGSTALGPVISGAAAASGGAGAGLVGFAGRAGIALKRGA